MEKKYTLFMMKDFIENCNYGLTHILSRKLPDISSIVSIAVKAAPFDMGDREEADWPAEDYMLSAESGRYGFAGFSRDAPPGIAAA